jgi:CTP synthase (UTP-ammonia lyase)
VAHFRERDTVNVAVIGDRLSGSAPQDHIATALAHSAAAIGARVEVEWFATPSLDGSAAAELLDDVDAVWCAPGGPYVSLDGALSGIRFARERERVFLGTCAGFQHAVIEFARHVLDIDDAHHAEYEAPSDNAPLIIDELLCSLVGQAMTVRLLDPRTRDLYGSTTATEEYYCRFGLNETYVPAFREAGLVVAGVDASDGTTRILRPIGHPFFYCTLFVPQTSSTAQAPHPIVTEYLVNALASTRTH